MSTEFFKSDSEIHHELSIRCHEVLRHPFLELLESASIPPAQMASLCHIKQNLGDGFLSLLSQAKTMAEIAGKTQLAMALRINLADEQGVDPISGQPNGLGSHHAWAKNFYEALNKQVVQYTNSEDNLNNLCCRFNLFARSHDASLSFIVGMLMATEKCIPLDFASWLKALIRTFPSLEARGWADPLFYWRDHIKHDEQRHLPDLVDGYLGRHFGAKGYVLLPDEINAQIQEGAPQDLIKGIETAISLRLKCYDLMLAQI